MCVGDGAVQLLIERPKAGDVEFDGVRNASSSFFTGAQSIWMTRWWRWLDVAFPAATTANLVRKLIVNQTVLTGTLTPSYMLWSGIVEPPLRGTAVDWDGLRERLRIELGGLLLRSWCLWLPIHIFNFTMLQPHMRVPIVASVTVLWNGYLSFVSHGRRG
jgi:hypothetical protein